MIRIANANMSRAIRAVSTERGYGLAQFALFAYGGAGPLHAMEIAAECGIPAVVVPQEPARCALAACCSRTSRSISCAARSPRSRRRAGVVCGHFASMETEAGAWLERERVAAADRSFRYHADARYQGQNFEVIVPLPRPVREGMDDSYAFHAAHLQEYGYDLPGKTIEIVNCRLQAVGRVQGAAHRVERLRRCGAALMGVRSIYHGAAHGWLDTLVYARAQLAAGIEIRGPAVIEEMSSYTSCPQSTRRRGTESATLSSTWKRRD